MCIACMTGYRYTSCNSSTQHDRCISTILDLQHRLARIASAYSKQRFSDSHARPSSVDEFGYVGTKTSVIKTAAVVGDL